MINLDKSILPNLTDMFDKYKDIMSTYKNKIPTNFKNYMSGNDKFVANLFGIDEDEINIYRNVIKLNTIFNNLCETIEIIKMVPEETEKNYITVQKYITEIYNIINYFYIEENIEFKNDYSFLHGDGKYKIMFTGHSYEDLQNLEKNILKLTIAKLDNPLSTDVIINGAESMKHLKEKLNIPGQRIHVAKDYRIAFVRYKNVTVILGITLKSGKEMDYSRYDSQYKNKNDFYKTIDKFIDGEMSLNDTHFKCINYINDFLKNEKKESRN